MTVDVVNSVTITLSEQEAEDLRYILDCISWDGEHRVARLAEDLDMALESVGVADILTNPYSASVEFDVDVDEEEDPYDPFDEDEDEEE